MKAVIEAASSRVAYLLAEAKITAAGLLSGSHLIALDVKPGTHAVVDAPLPIPEPWIDGAYALINSEWLVADAAVVDAERRARLESARQQAVARINREAGERRAAVITVTPGQEGTYLTKAAEAKAYLAAAAPDPADYPYLAAEAAALDVPLADLAATVAETAAAWHALNAAIEAARRAAVVAIASATTVEDVAAVFPVAWPDI